jgi:hypothetical protein
MSWKMTIATAPVVVVTFAAMTFGAVGDSSTRDQSARPAARQRTLLHANWPRREFLPGVGVGAPIYDGPIYNHVGQWIGTYRGPILGLSTTCNILTPAGYLYTCQNFTW